MDEPPNTDVEAEDSFENEAEDEKSKDPSSDVVKKDEKKSEKKGDVSLANELEKNGLDPGFWLSKFKDLGIENVRQLQHANNKIVKTLCKDKQFAWEENALKSCIRSHENLSKDTLERKQEKQNQLDKVKSTFEENMEKLNDIMNEKDRMERMHINIPMPQDQIELHEKLAKMEFREMGLAERKEIEPLELICKISGGRILRGYYLHENQWLRVLPRKQLIQISDDVSILAPRMEETFSSDEFHDQEKSALFDHVVQHWGVSATASVGSLGTFSVDIQGAIMHTDDEKTSSNSSTGYTEIKETVFVPTASFSLEDVSHFLSTEAANELSKLAKRLPSRNYKELCKHFFETFGSHYFAGTYHFGGRYTRSVVCRSHESMKKSESMSLTKMVLQAGAEGMVDWFSGGITVKGEYSKDQSNANLKENEDYKVTKKIVKCGGPTEVDLIPQWKLGLVKFPSTWNVIDQDVHKNEWKGVWELLTDDLSSRFQNIDHLRSALKYTWEKEHQDKIEEHGRDRK